MLCVAWLELEHSKSKCMQHRLLIGFIHYVACTQYMDLGDSSAQSVHPPFKTNAISMHLPTVPAIRSSVNTLVSRISILTEGCNLQIYTVF